jgi:hypothetical protein
MYNQLTKFKNIRKTCAILSDTLVVSLSKYASVLLLQSVYPESGGTISLSLLYRTIMVLPYGIESHKLRMKCPSDLYFLDFSVEYING